MAKRNNRNTPSRTGSDTRAKTSGDGATSTPSTADGVEQRVVAFAEQVGRVVGTVQGKAEGWCDRTKLTGQIGGIRDAAADLVERLTGGQSAPSPNQAPAAPKAAPAKSRAPATDSSVSRSAGRSGGVVDAPGKKHRKPMPSARGVKSDSRIAKMRVLNETRTRRRG